MRSSLEVSFVQLQKYYYVLMENSSFKAEKRRNEKKQLSDYCISDSKAASFE